MYLNKFLEKVQLNCSCPDLDKKIDDFYSIAIRYRSVIVFTIDPLLCYEMPSPAPHHSALQKLLPASNVAWF